MESTTAVQSEMPVMPAPWWQRLPRLLFAVVGAMSVAAILLNSFADPDLWGHTRYGLDILRDARLTSADPYSFTSDQAWVNHEWLAEVLTALAYTIAGRAGLLALKVLVLVIALAGLWMLVRVPGVTAVTRGCLMWAAAVGIAPQGGTVRPQLFSIACFVWLVYGLVSWWQRGSRPRAVGWTVLVFALWANLHGGFLVGLGFVGLYAAVQWYEKSASLVEAGALFAAAASGTLATPYGFRLWGFLRDTVGLGRSDITDWRPLLQDPTQLIPWVPMVVVLVWCIRRAGWDAARALAPAIALALLTVRVSRIQCFFAIATIALGAPWLRGIGSRALLLPKPPRRGDLAIAAAIVLGAAAGAVGIVGRSPACLPPEARWNPMRWAPEPEVAQFVKANRLRGRLLTWFDYGQYALWHFYPDLLVSYDGRRETVYSPRVQQAHLMFYFQPTAVGYADTIHADYAWLPNWLPAVKALQHHGWHVIFRGRVSSVLSRRPGSFTLLPPFIGTRCFPGP